MTVLWLTAFLDFPPAVFDVGCSFWRAVTGYALSPPRGDAGEFATLLPDRGDAFLRVQRIDQGPAGCHLDLHADAMHETVGRAQRLGARVIADRSDVVVLDSPGGLVFCVVEHEGEARRPPPARWHHGHRSLVDQLCLDIPPAVFAEECRFWTLLTGWELRDGSRPEFRFLARPDAMPLRLLLQRIDDEHAGRCRAHLDLAGAEVAAERRRHEALGAVPVRTSSDWTTLRDPAGLSYCITRRSPDTGQLAP